MNGSKRMAGAAVAWALASGVAAVDRHVPDEYPTIQAAVEASMDGDMVRVAPGTYAPFDMGDKLIVVESTGGAAVTTIDAAGLPTSAVKFGPNSTFTSTLRGFTIRTGSGTILPDGVWRAGGGCYLLSGTGAAATIEDCVFVGATGGCGYGAGIWARKANLVVRRCRFIGLSAIHSGPAITVEPVPSLTVPGEPDLHCLIEDSSIGGSSSYNDGGILCLPNHPTVPVKVRIARCEFVENGAVYQGGALIVDGGQTSAGGEVIVDRCVFRNNNASLANSIGLALFDGNQDFRLTLRGSVFADPSVSVRRARGQVSLENTRFCAGPSAVAGSYDDLGGNVWSCPPAADCDGDGMDDLYQVTLGLAADVNANGIPDVCEPAPCPGDTNDSGVVNAVDISIILSAWGTDGGKFPGADTNDDGTVDGSDLAEVLAGWGPCP